MILPRLRELFHIASNIEAFHISATANSIYTALSQARNTEGTLNNARIKLAELSEALRVEEWRTAGLRTDLAEMRKVAVNARQLAVDRAVRIEEYKGAETSALNHVRFLSEHRDRIRDGTLAISDLKSFGTAQVPNGWLSALVASPIDKIRAPDVPPPPPPESQIMGERN